MSLLQKKPEKIWQQSFIYISIHRHCQQHTSSSSSALGFGAPPLAVLHFLLFFLSGYFYRSSGSGVVPSPSQCSEQRSEVSPLSCSGGKQIQATDQNTTEFIANCVKQQISERVSMSLSAGVSYQYFVG